MTSSSPVGTARGDVEPGSMRFSATRSRSPARPRPRRGSRPASAGSCSSIRCDLARGARAAYSREDLDVAPAVGVRRSPASGAGRRARPASRSTSARASSPSSRSSGFVNAAWAGPRRPSRITSSTVERPVRDRVVGGIRDATSSGSSTQHARDVDRHVAVADHHGARRRRGRTRVRGTVGVAVVPGDELRGGCEPGRSSPGIPSRLSSAVPTA